MITTKEGRVLLYHPESSMASQRGYVYRYRWIMSQELGRPLKAQEVVHHKDGNCANDAIDNLDVLSASEHMVRHALKKAEASGYELNKEKPCAGCGEIKPISEFTLHTVRGRLRASSQCKQCAAAQQRERRRRLGLLRPRRGWCRTANGKCRAYIHVNGKQSCLGTFETPHEARAAYAAAKEKRP